MEWGVPTGGRWPDGMSIVVRTRVGILSVQPPSKGQTNRPTYP